MKNIYDLLNNTGIKMEEYPVETLTELEKAKMKRHFRQNISKSRIRAPRRWATIAACTVCVIGFSQTAFAKNMAANVIKTIHLGNGTVVEQVDPSKEKESTIQYYDKDGKPIDLKDQTGKSGEIYDKNGKNLGSIRVSVGGKDTAETGTVQEKDWSKAAKQLSFNALMPDKVPTGYTFDHASLYIDKNGKPSGDYLMVTYKNGDSKIVIHERKITPKSAYAAATNGTVKETTVNGEKAALENDHELIWNVNNKVNIVVFADGLSSDELISFAESMK